MVEDYLTYPKTFEGYQWYKPIVTMVLTLVIYVILVSVEYPSSGSGFDSE